MVFSDKKSKTMHHNRVNIRDTSTEPTNLHGDANLPSSRMGRQESTNDLNDRAEDPEDSDQPPPLETGHLTVE